jgi:hypothetical protein
MAGLAELEAWLSLLDLPKLPTEPEIELWEMLADLDGPTRPAPPAPPEGGDALDLFCEQGEAAR